MPLREECLWETLTPQRPEAPALSGEVTVDVCVIGAGITGLSAAIHLLEQGKTVAVVEAHRTGQGDWSTRACGFPLTKSKSASAKKSAASSTPCSAMRRHWCSA
jgi:heterodisulfide reductase subunit A-like polyferredoxin